MPLSSQVCRGTARSCGNVQFDHLSVSDNPILALAQFVGCGRQRRYGSSVPGPLESRRRNRRRNMDMAMAGARAAADATLLFGPGNNAKARELPAINSEPQVPSPPPFYAPAHPPIREIEQILASRLTDASSVSDIRALVADLDISLDERPSLSEALFQRVLDTHYGDTWQSISEIHAFLKDRSLNIPGTRGCAALVERLVERGAEPGEIEGHIDFLGWAAESGIICVDELAAIVKRIPDIKTPTGTIRDTDPDRLGSLFGSLWEGVVAGIQSGTYRDDLDCTVWLDTLLSLPPTTSSLDVVKDIFTTCYRRRIPIPYGTHYILQLLRLATSNGHVPAAITHSDDILCLRYLKDINSLSKLAGARVFAHCIVGVTEMLAYSADYREISAECFVTWAWILQRLRRAPVLLAKGVAIKMEYGDYTGVRITTMDSRRRCVLKLWIVMTLGFHTGRSESSRLRREETFTDLLEDLRHLCPANDDIFTTLVNVLQELKLEGLANPKPVLMRVAKMEYRRIVDEKGDLSGRIDRLVGLIESRYMSLEDVLKQFRPRPNSTERFWVPHPWFVRMSQSADITSPQYLEEMLQNIENSQTRRAILIGILSHHVGAKIALRFSHTCGPRHARSDLLEQDSDTPGCQSLKPHSDASAIGSWTPDGRFIPDPAACLEFFTTLSLIFAYSPGLSPRVSWGLTYWCYLYLQTHGAPLRPAVARALHYAGVVRYREENMKVSPEVFQIVLHLVGEVEGQKAAEILKWRHEHG